MRKRRSVTQDYFTHKEVSLGPFILNPEQKTECPSIANFSHGFLDCSNGFAPESVCSFKCNQGFYLSGLPPTKKSIECVSTTESKWDHAIPTCEDVNECTENLTYPCGDKQCINSQGTFKCNNCSVGFVLGSTTLQCDTGKESNQLS